MRCLFPFMLAFATSATLVPQVAVAQESRSDWLDIEVGKSVVLETPRVPTAIAITDPEVVNVESLGEASKIQVQGLSIGNTDLIIQFGPGIPPMIYEITVHRDLTDLIRRVDAVVEGEPPRVYPLGERIVVEGEVDDLDTLEQVTLVARIYDEDFVNLMHVRGDHQVQLEVLFAEVSRRAVRSLGLNLLYGNTNLGIGLFGSATGATGVRSLTATNFGIMQTAGLVQSPIAGGTAVMGWLGAIDLAFVMGMLDDYAVGKVLAQPVLVSLSGQRAEFLGGGEVPIPAPAGGGAGVRAIQVDYKPYGTSLAFVPTVLANDVVDIRMELQVSELDYGNGTRVTGIELPGFVTRKAEAHLRIESGMTFAVAGLLGERSNFSRSGIPGLGRIPILGSLFRTVTHNRQETEVVIYVTPRLVRPLAPGEVPAAPGAAENNNPSDFELFFLGMPHRPGSRTAEPTGAVGLHR